MLGKAGDHNPGGTAIRKNTTPIQMLRNDDVGLDSKTRDFRPSSPHSSSPIMLQHTIPACPHLPQVTCELPITHTREHRATCGETYYIVCLELAQSLWQNNKPAQAILQLDKAMMANIPADSTTLDTHPIPYRAMVWFMTSTQTGSFIGNPVRHFQHLASRMNLKQPQPELRTARAWACLHLAESLLNREDYPRDQRQLDKENLEIPNKCAVKALLVEFSPHQLEKTWFEQAMSLVV